jgi:hypothetical protein
MTTTTNDTDNMTPREIAYYTRVGHAQSPQAMETAFERGRFEIGDRVTFPSPSAPGGLRVGRITSTGPKRARIAFKFYNGRSSTCSVRYRDLSPSLWG